MRLLASVFQLVGVVLIVVALWFVDWRLSLGLLGAGAIATGFAAERRQSIRDALADR